MRYRELSEINRAHGYDDSNQWDKTKQLAYDSRQQSFDFDDDNGDYAFLGKIDDFDVAEHVTDEDDVGTTVVVFDHGERIAFVEGASTGIIDDAMQVRAIRVDPKYKGRNIALRLYELILKQGLCNAIVADDDQTPEGMRLWANMLASKRFKLFVLDDEKGRTIAVRTAKTLAQVYDIGKYDRDHMYLFATL